MATKESKATKQDHERLLGNLKILQKLHGADLLAEAVGCSKSTWFNRMKEPWRQFSYDDLKAISACCKVDFVSLVDEWLDIR